MGVLPVVPGRDPADEPPTEEPTDEGLLAVGFGESEEGFGFGVFLSAMVIGEVRFRKVKSEADDEGVLILARYVSVCIVEHD